MPLHGAEADGEKAPDGMVKAIDRLSLLEEEIARHDRLYFDKARPEITDREYDRLVAERRTLREDLPSPPVASREDFPEGDAVSPQEDRSNDYLAHRVPMLSLRKARGEVGLRQFHARIRRAAGGPVPGGFVIEPKYDGMAVSLVYIKGRFERALSRGDGSRGTDLTEQLLAVGDFPVRLPSGTEEHGKALPEYLEIRGEVYIRPSVFAAFNRTLEESGNAPYATPRNLASGTLQLEDSSEIASRDLELVVFGYGAWEPEDMVPASQAELLKQLEKWNFAIPDWEHSEERIDRLEQNLHQAASRIKRADLPADGVVLKVNDTALQRRLGTGSLFPHWALACKFSGPTGETRIKDIRFQVGRSGKLTAVGEVEPVDLGGRTIRKVNLHHAAYIASRDIRIGDPVIMELAGDSIPVITTIQLRQRPDGSVPFAVPGDCPSCGSRLTGELSSLRCPFMGCPARNLQRIVHFSNCVGIQGLGEKTVAELQEAGLLRTVPDLYRLAKDAGKVERILGSEQAGRLLASVERSRTASLAEAVRGLGLDGVGRISSGLVAERIHGLSDLLPSEGPSQALLEVLPGTALEALSDPAQARYWERLVRDLVRAGLGQAEAAAKRDRREENFLP